MTKSEAKSTAVELYNYGENAGAGFDTMDNEHFSVPFLNLLQVNSPEVNEAHEKRIEGAKAGMFFNSVTRELYSTKDGVILVPCETQRKFVEWVPRNDDGSGGSFVAVHEPSDQIVLDAQAAAKAAAPAGARPSLKLKTTNKNDLKETFYLFCLVLENENAEEAMGMAVIGFTSTKIKKYKAILTQLRTFSSKTPLFSHRLRMKSVPDRNKKGQTFFNVEVTPLFGGVAKSMIPPTLSNGDPHPILVAGRGLLDSIRGGAATVAHETAAEGSAPEEFSGDEVF